MLVWLALLLITAISGWLAETHVVARWAMVVIVLIATFKVAAIQWHFMELKHAPISWRASLLGWGGLSGLIALFGSFAA
jgi:Prokaryotic Cytochrome C oxidase subunit IV